MRFAPARSAAGLALVLVFPLLGTAVAEQPAPRCFGERATIAGTSEADVIAGTDGDDVIVGLGGDDVIRGLGGHDRICGGPGNDRVIAGPGDDAIAVGAGEDDASGGPGNDLLAEFASGAGSLVDADAQDRSTDVLSGGPGVDWINAEGGNDVLLGGPGRDLALHISSFGNLVVDLGLGTAVSRQGGVDTLVGIEDVLGSLGTDVLRGDDGDNLLWGLTGMDVLFGADGDDALLSSVSGAILDGGAAPNGDAAVVVLDEPTRADLSTGQIDSLVATNDLPDRLIDIENLVGGTRGDIVIGDFRANLLWGRDGDDVVDGGPGDDRLWGDDPVFIAGGRLAMLHGPGRDQLDGNDGNDVLDGGPKTDSCTRGETVKRCEEFPATPDSRSTGAGTIFPFELPWWSALLPVELGLI